MAASPQCDYALLAANLQSIVDQIALFPNLPPQSAEIAQLRRLLMSFVETMSSALCNSQTSINEVEIAGRSHAAILDAHEAAADAPQKSENLLPMKLANSAALGCDDPLAGPNGDRLDFT